ncbi:MAG: nucleoside 2-deoxyribosyltransferase [Desulfobacteraceae bacterium]|nr:nucleoside 2-deoxyribosyltransferase [Desulfobacteraceae bacterium]
MKIYFAGPLFSESERDWIRAVIRKIEALGLTPGGRKLEITFPYDLMPKEEMEKLGANVWPEIFSRCRSHLENADLVIALLDGTQVDDGTAWELGYFYAIRSPERKMIGIRTDFRRAGEGEGSCLNSMIQCSCDLIVTSTEALLAEITRIVRGR